MDKGKHSYLWLTAAAQFIEELRKDEVPQEDQPDQKIGMWVSDSKEVWTTKKPRQEER